MAALAEMYVQGVSTRKVKAITEELCGHSFSASSISAINQRLDDGLAQFADRRLVEAFPYLILDARYERVREAGVRRLWRSAWGAVMTSGIVVITPPAAASTRDATPGIPLSRAPAPTSAAPPRSPQPSP